MREKYNLIKELKEKNKQLQGLEKLSLVGIGDFPGGNNVMRGGMNIKHISQHLCIDNPEFPFMYDGKENVRGEYSSYHTEANHDYKVVKIIKKYEQLLKGRSHMALYFLYSRQEDKYVVIQRKTVENLTENFGFDYNNDFLDNTQEGDIIPEGARMVASTSYDDYGNMCIGINGRIINAVHPAVQDDAIVVSESFAKRAITNKVVSLMIPINENSVLIDLYGDGTKNGYQGLPNIGDFVTNGIVAATRNIKESRMFSDMRDSSLKHVNFQSDQKYYGEGEVIDINVYCNNPNIKVNKVNRQLIEYYNDAKYFYTQVYRTCKSIINSGAAYVSSEIHRWMKRAMDYLDVQSVWAFNENVYSNLLVEVLLRNKEPIKRGSKIVGRHGNKTVVSAIWPDEDMPYLVRNITVDEYGRAHPVGPVERCDMMTNPNALINRTIAISVEEGSVTFILDLVRKHAATLKTQDEQKEFIFDVMKLLNHKQGEELEALYETLSEREKRKFIESCISINPDGTLKTSEGLYLRWEAFDDSFCLRDNIVDIYEKYGDIIQPYHIFMPKRKWGRDIHIGQDCVGYQYTMVLKQNAAKGFSVRSAGAISEESLPEKSHGKKTGKMHYSDKPIRFGKVLAEIKLVLTAGTSCQILSTKLI